MSACHRLKEIFRRLDRFPDFQLADPSDFVNGVVALAAHAVEEGQGRRKPRVEVLPGKLNDGDLKIYGICSRKLLRGHPASSLRGEAGWPGIGEWKGSWSPCPRSGAPVLDGGSMLQDRDRLPAAGIKATIAGLVFQ